MTQPVIWVDVSKLSPVQIGRLKAGDHTVLGELGPSEVGRVWGRVWPVDEWWRPSSQYLPTAGAGILECVAALGKIV